MAVSVPVADREIGRPSLAEIVPYPFPNTLMSFTSSVRIG